MSLFERRGRVLKRTLACRFDDDDEDKVSACEAAGSHMPAQQLRDWLSNCGIGEAGMAALASAIAAGPVPSCNWIHLDGNPGSAAAVKAADWRFTTEGGGP